MRYANITSIPSSYIGAFFSSLGDASPPGEADKLQVYQPILPTRCVMGPLKYNETFKHSIVFIYICIMDF